MATQACGRGKSKDRCLCTRAMAQVAGYCLMCALQGITARIMLRNRIARWRVPRNRVALLASARLRPLGKSSLVVITMAVATGCEPGHVPDIAFGVAFVAGNRDMLSLQWIAGLAVVEFGLVRHVPTRRIMAVFAHRAEFSFVRIGMTVEAAGKRYSGKFGVHSFVSR